MKNVREIIGGLGNILFKQAYLWSQFRDGQVPDIYLQSEKYFAKYKEEIRQLFGWGIGSQRIDKIALHIRRGDYLKAAQFHVPLWQTDYYKNAVQIFPNETFLVFCKDNQDKAVDEADKKWCEEYMQNLGVKFEMYEHGIETDDLNVMANCKSIIGANSTFSWWAAYLGNHEIRIFPHEKFWFTDGIIRTELPENIMRLNVKYLHE